MKLLFDLHTHTVASGHAFSTLKENIEEAAAKGLKAMGTSDHYSAMPGSAQPIYFTNFKAIKEKILGVRIFTGMEANIIDLEGKLDAEEAVLKKMDYVIASLHVPCVKAGNMKTGDHIVQSSCSLCKSRNQRGKYQCIDRSYEKSICEDHRTSR